MFRHFNSHFGCGRLLLRFGNWQVEMDAVGCIKRFGNGLQEWMRSAILKRFGNRMSGRRRSASGDRRRVNQLREDRNDGLQHGLQRGLEHKLSYFRQILLVIVIQ